MGGRGKARCCETIAAAWCPEDIGVQCEDDVLWGSWAQADQERAYRSAYADEGA